MMKQLYALLVLGVFVVACSSEPKTRVVTDFTQGWTFKLQDDSLACDSSFDDRSWRTLDLPHDWSIESDFDLNYPATPGGGALPGGVGWYRKEFSIDQLPKGRMLYVDFDGIYWNSKVWLNGHLLGVRPNGYSSMRYDLTPYIQVGAKNLLAVRVDNGQQPNSRWYSGSGIYRNVRLVEVNALHVNHWGTYITTPVVSAQQAEIQIETSINNSTETAQEVELISLLIDEKGEQLEQVSTLVSLPKSGVTVAKQVVKLQNPCRWSIKTPYLYKVITQIKQGKALKDEYQTSIGIRSFSFDAQQGFILNGERVKIKGVCMHHDLGCLGAAVNVRAMERQLEILREMGCNGIRTAHNPPAPEFLDLCDKMGFVVMDEAFDMWRKRKSPHDYATYFAAWYERDLTDLIVRDRNHPSVFMWSIGNEILEQWTDINTDTLNLQQANMMFNFASSINQTKETNELHVNSLLTIKLADLVKRLDPTRPVSSGNNEAGVNNHLFKSGAMDIIGINYNDKRWESLPQTFPGQKFICTESTSSLMSRGVYEMPADSIFIRPERWDKPYFKEENQCSSFDNSHAPWGTTHEETWKLIKKQDHMAGVFVWTGFDYLGEPTPFWWPSRSSYFGIVDLAGIPKDVYYMYQSEWTDQAVLHLFPHWNWSAGSLIDVWAYYNQADEVELFLNNQSLGKRDKKGEELHVSWRVPFSAGVLKAVSSKQGRVVLTKEIKTAGDPVAIKLSADRKAIKADGKDLCFVTVEAIDAAGNSHPTAHSSITFKVEGEGTLVGTDNGDPTDHHSLKGSVRNLFSGKAVAVIQSKRQKGSVKLIATSPQLKGASVVVEIR